MLYVRSLSTVCGGNVLYVNGSIAVQTFPRHHIILVILTKSSPITYTVLSISLQHQYWHCLNTVTTRYMYMYEQLLKIWMEKVSEKVPAKDL